MTSLIRQVNIHHNVDDDNASAIKLNLLDIYKIRMLRVSWKNVILYDRVHSDLQNLCFSTFVQHYTVAKNSKILTREKIEFYSNFHP